MFELLISTKLRTGGKGKKKIKHYNQWRVQNFFDGWVGSCIPRDHKCTNANLRMIAIHQFLKKIFQAKMINNCTHAVAHTPHRPYFLQPASEGRGGGGVGTSQPGQRVPLHRSGRLCGAGSMSLAFAQEEFLVKIWTPPFRFKSIL